MPVRIGIDVGGTFTHAVAIAADKFELIAQAKVPTTHKAKEGVARGIIDSLQTILTEAKITPDQISYIAHSTTQATNALLEADVSPVGIIAIGSGIEGSIVATETKLEPIELAPGKNLIAIQKYLEINEGETLKDETIVQAIKELQEKGAEAIVAATAFSVDNPEIEKKVIEVSRKLGIPSTATHEISLLYGLTARTRTAAINAAILPKMIQTADMTEKAAKSMGITAPIVVMRSDGGAMGIDEMRRRPIMTLLSGPAAGVAAALMAAKIADGIFLEVGGTSTDISCILNGHPSVKMSQIGEHKIYLNTVDVRTVGVAGGSLSAIKNGKVFGVGPRSAHIAGLKYVSFAPSEFPQGSVPTLISLPSDSSHYMVLETETDRSCWTITTTCAANFLGYIPQNDYASGKTEIVKQALQKFADFLHFESPKKLALEIMERGAQPIINTVKELLNEKQLTQVSLIGGGGGASVWVHYLGEKLGFPATIVENAPVISAIGAALALLQETVERTIVNPKPEDFIEIRERAESALIKAGSNADTIEVRVEVDEQRGVLRATAVGSMQMSIPEENLPIEELALKAEPIMNLQKGDGKLFFQTRNFFIFHGETIKKTFFGFFKTKSHPWVVLDNKGRVRLSAKNGKLFSIKSQHLFTNLKSIAETNSTYGDAGLIIPNVFLVTNNRTVDFSGLISIEQMSTLCQEEQRKLKTDEHVVIALRLEGN